MSYNSSIMMEAKQLGKPISSQNVHRSTMVQKQGSKNSVFYSPNASREQDPTTRRMGDDSRFGSKRCGATKKSLTTTKYVLTNVIPRNTKPGRQKFLDDPQEIQERLSRSPDIKGTKTPQILPNKDDPGKFSGFLFEGKRARDLRLLRQKPSLERKGRDVDIVPISYDIRPSKEILTTAILANKSADGRKWRQMLHNFTKYKQTTDNQEGYQYLESKKFPFIFKKTEKWKHQNSKGAGQSNIRVDQYHKGSNAQSPKKGSTIDPSYEKNSSGRNSVSGGSDTKTYNTRRNIRANVISVEQIQQASQNNKKSEISVKSPSPSLHRMKSNASPTLKQHHQRIYDEESVRSSLSIIQNRKNQLLNNLYNQVPNKFQSLYEANDARLILAENRKKYKDQVTGQYSYNQQLSQTINPQFNKKVLMYQYKHQGSNPTRNSTHIKSAGSLEDLRQNRTSEKKTRSPPQTLMQMDYNFHPVEVFSKNYELTEGIQNTSADEATQGDNQGSMREQLDQGGYISSKQKMKILTQPGSPDNAEELNPLLHDTEMPDESPTLREFQSQVIKNKYFCISPKQAPLSQSWAQDGSIAMIGSLGSFRRPKDIIQFDHARSEVPGKMNLRFSQNNNKFGPANFRHGLQTSQKLRHKVRPSMKQKKQKSESRSQANRSALSSNKPPTPSLEHNKAILNSIKQMEQEPKVPQTTKNKKTSMPVFHDSFKEPDVPMHQIFLGEGIRNLTECPAIIAASTANTKEPTFKKEMYPMTHSLSPKAEQSEYNKIIMEQRKQIYARTIRLRKGR